MKVLNIGVLELKAGMVLYQDIINNFGVTVLAKDTVLDNRMVERIKQYGIEKLMIKVCEMHEKSSEEAPNIKSIIDKNRINIFKIKYASKVEQVTLAIKAIGNGQNIDIHEINMISRDLIYKFDTMGEVLNYLSLVKPLDDYTYSHSLNVSLISIIIAKWMKLSEDYIDELASAALLHDIGKTKVPREILEKPEKLTSEEFEEIKKHTIYGYEMMQDMTGIGDRTKNAALMHHEKIDGSGYPLGYKDENIPLMAKIIAVADIFDAMTSNRCYREKLCPFSVIKGFEINEYGKLDTKVLTTFLSNIANSYVGDFVELNNGEICEVVFINPNRLWQPIVKSGSQFIDLSKSNLQIVSIV